MEDSEKIWLKKDDWDLNMAWNRWRNSTFHIPAEEAKSHPLYKDVQVVLDRMEKKKLNEVKE
jgi:hypothetical protein